MNSYVELTVVEAPGHSFAAAFANVQAEVQRLEAVLSDYDARSNVGRLNRRDTMELAPETALLLRRAQEVCHETDGAFDVSMGPIKRLWGFADDAAVHIPTAAEIDTLLRHVGCDVYRIDAAGRLHWNDPQAQLDLGGIAQGLVAQRIAEVLETHGFSRFLINVSGDLVARGRRPDGGAWRIGVQHPRQPDSLLTRLSLSMAALTTSGDYEQVVFEDGIRLHHIFDPATGWPARGAASVSVLSNDAIDADCYATAVFVLGPEKGMQFLESKSNLEGLISFEDATGALHVLRSSGLSGPATNQANQ
jgi:thiamine biosynthesis lipoprotein